MMDTISWEDFEKVDIRVWKIIDVQDFSEAKKPAYKIWVDFWEWLWIKKTSAQITRLYKKDYLIGKHILWVVNFPPKQIGNFISEFLLTWFESDSWIIIATTEQDTPLWKKLL